jgi:putative copper export protein
MTLDSWLHFGHVLSAIVWVGGGLMLSIVGLRVRASGDSNAIRQFAGTLSYADTRVLLPAVVGTLALASGWSSRTPHGTSGSFGSSSPSVCWPPPS